MELCLVRHAIGEERGPRWPDDRLRPLSPEGIERMEQAARGLRKFWRPEAILTSPLVRARQTAEIIAEAMGGPAPRDTNTLATGDDDGLLKAVNAAGAGRVLAVGHEPTISMTLAFLLAGDDMAFRVEFKKGAAAMVVFPARAAGGTGMLAWHLPPAAMRAMAGSRA
jgi:phosphohistidine phosphatase